MKRFLIYVVMLWLMSGAVVGAAKLARPQSPLSPGLRLLHLEDCTQPCWLGIVPGRTTTPDAYQKIAQSYSNRHYGSITTQTFPTGVIFLNGETIIGEISVVEQQNMVKEIHFSLANPRLYFPTDDLFSIFGQPSYLFDSDVGAYQIAFGRQDSSTLSMVISPRPGSKGCEFRVTSFIFAEPEPVAESAVREPWTNLDLLRWAEACPNAVPKP